MTVIQETRRLH